MSFRWTLVALWGRSSDLNDERTPRSPIADSANGVAALIQSITLAA
jgi:hypothetical protein